MGKDGRYRNPFETRPHKTSELLAAQPQEPLDGIVSDARVFAFCLRIWNDFALGVGLDHRCVCCVLQFRSLKPNFFERNHTLKQGSVGSRSETSFETSLAEVVSLKVVAEQVPPQHFWSSKFLVYCCFCQLCTWESLCRPQRLSESCVSRSRGTKIGNLNCCKSRDNRVILATGVICET